MLLLKRLMYFKPLKLYRHSIICFLGSDSVTGKCGRSCTARQCKLLYMISTAPIRSENVQYAVSLYYTILPTHTLIMNSPFVFTLATCSVISLDGHFTCHLTLFVSYGVKTCQVIFIMQRLLF